MKEKGGLNISKLAALISIEPEIANIKNLEINTPNSYIHTSNIHIPLAGINNIKEWIVAGTHTLQLKNNVICPADFASLLPALKPLDYKIAANIDVEIEGSALTVRDLTLSTSDNMKIRAQGNIINLFNESRLESIFPVLEVKVAGAELAKLISAFTQINNSEKNILERLKFIDANLPFTFSHSQINTDATISSSFGVIALKGDISFAMAKTLGINASIDADNFNIGALTGISELGQISMKGDGDVTISQGTLNGEAEMVLASIDFNGEKWSNIYLKAKKEGNNISGEVRSDDNKALFAIAGDVNRDETGRWIAHINGGATNLNIGLANWSHVPSPWSVTGDIDIDASATSIEDLLGSLNLHSFTIHNIAKGDLDIGTVKINIKEKDVNMRVATLDSSLIKGKVSGNYDVAEFVSTIRHLLARALPSLINVSEKLPPWINPKAGNGFLDAHFQIPHDNPAITYFNLPVKPLDDIHIHASIDENRAMAALQVNAPYLLQGKDKIISGTKLSLSLDALNDVYEALAETTLPVKSNRMKMQLKADALNDLSHATLSWVVNRENSFKGSVGLEALLSKQMGYDSPAVEMKVLQSSFDINDTTWHVEPATLKYADNTLKVDGVKIWSRHQFAEISGTGGNSPSDTLMLRLNDIDLGYVFETLAINYVTFGGRATGDFYASNIFTKAPDAFTNNLFVKNFKYNGAVLGDAHIKSHWDNGEKEVCIYADISEGKSHRATIDGGVYVARDSLTFDFDTDKVDIKFLQPFMAAFTSEVSGRASGHAHLYGTFSDIDLQARLYADTISMKVDYTNVRYSGGSDSIIINPGYIGIKDFTLHDPEGHTATLNGYVKHRYFHDPVFEFKITNARNLLCYDTNAKINADWYGKIYGIGTARISGSPGITGIMVDMQTAPGSTFTFVLNDMEMAADYNFLTFVDTHKQKEHIPVTDSIADKIKLFQTKVKETEMPSVFNMDLRATITPQTEIIIVMDPVAGDKIKAFGNGAMQMAYSTSDEELTMHGKYVLDKGTYNFSLQDLILKTFNIRPGSYIAFNGDPYRAVLGIEAVYKVNTNLSDLDKSFSTDKDLNRTNVPVEAVLKVEGELQHPDISFDLNLPTLTQDVERKVKSIVSTDEMMNRQIIYLLALNRFYTPEYMGASRSGNELASFASTTISSHLTNILDQLSGNWSFMPSIRTDAGDFSDMEVDLALSSSLLNNRLLLNGNFGYRDRATSNTAFVGDFDLEYLLNKKGSFRLKAYNHYNDQNYYLKSALTTQGVGVVYMHDFNSWFKFLRKRRNNKNLQEKKLPADSIR